MSKLLKKITGDHVSDHDKNDFSPLSLLPAPLRKIGRQSSRTLGVLSVLGDGFYIAAKHGAIRQPNQPEHTRLVRYFCRRLCEVLHIEVTVHAPMPEQQALWVSNHVSWMDIPVVGSVSKVFFLAKAEIESWPVIGALARAGGTLFIKRGSGDSGEVKAQISGFLQQQIPVLFFPEATTTNGLTIKKLHGKLLVSAIETATPVQPVVLCYVNAQGELDMRAPFIDEMTFATHLADILTMDKIDAHVLPLAAIDPVGHTVDSLTQLLHERMSAGLASLQQQVLRAV